MSFSGLFWRCCRKRQPLQAPESLFPEHAMSRYLAPPYPETVDRLEYGNLTVEGVSYFYNQIPQELEFLYRKNIDFYTQCHTAAYSQQTDISAIVDLLADPEVQVDFDNAQWAWWRPIHYAARHGHLPLVKLLAQHEANIYMPVYTEPDNPCDPAPRYLEKWQTPIELAYYNQHHQVVEYLRQAGAHLSDEFIADADALINFSQGMGRRQNKGKDPQERTGIRFAVV